MIGSIAVGIFLLLTSGFFWQRYVTFYTPENSQRICGKFEAGEDNLCFDNMRFSKQIVMYVGAVEDGLAVILFLGALRLFFIRRKMKQKAQIASTTVVQTQPPAPTQDTGV